ncbi:MAG TPA: hypothetical protein PKO47_03385 [bacterium]|nr:hypothetical protein [bacterium]
MEATMKVLNYNTILMCLCVCLTACSEGMDTSSGDKQPPHFEWDPGSATVILKDMIQYGENNIAILSLHYDTNRYGLTGFTPNGIQKFQKFLPATHYIESSYFERNLSYSNGIFTLVINPKDTGQNSLFIQLDTNGNITNQKELVQIKYASIFPMNNGEYLVRSSIFDSLQFKTKLSKIDNDGELKWEKVMPVSFEYLHVANNRIYGKWNNDSIVSIDANGDVLWKQSLMLPKGFLLCRVSSSDYRIARILYNPYNYIPDRLAIDAMDIDGAITPLDTIPLNWSTDFTDFESLGANELVLLGRWGGSNKILLMRLQSDGSWVESHLAPDENNFSLVSFHANGDGTYLIMGAMYINSSYYSKTLIYKIDANGNYLPF